MAQRFNVFGRLFDIERRGEQWLALYVGNDGKRAPAGFVIPEFVTDGELEQFLFDLFHEQAAYKKGSISRVAR
ncbi:hypothetical protein J2X20_003047 [Pelomonas saccharophila]|uniref:DUF7661 domain-containing protein n=1 Tax=Roseateles saccharophilus TaxID=304 RepID=A0ABU1YNH1_ROSSA|nr:hypothetical protein [Roseateles saccharophilus]MDR7270389.1 hypothetical protein [Roseateles saccharophilus]